MSPSLHKIPCEASEKQYHLGGLNPIDLQGIEDLSDDQRWETGYSRITLTSGESHIVETKKLQEWLTSRRLGGSYKQPKKPLHSLSDKNEQYEILSDRYCNRSWALTIGELRIAEGELIEIMSDKWNERIYAVTVGEMRDWEEKWAGKVMEWEDRFCMQVDEGIRKFGIIMKTASWRHDKEAPTSPVCVTSRRTKGEELNTEISEEPTLLEQANQILNKDRQKDYGNAVQNHVDIAQMWTVYLRANGKLPEGTTISPKDVCQLMILLKVARQGKSSKTDNLVDICGYADIQEQIAEDEERRTKSSSRACNKRDCCKGKDCKRAS